MEEELAAYLATIERDGRYVADAVLKESAAELTQRVRATGADATCEGTFIRKYIMRDAGMGAAYERIFAAQQQGTRLVGIPRIFECYAHGEQLVVLMECVRGETLAQVVERRGASAWLAGKVFPELCDAVSCLHERFDPPLIHRDLKPENVMVGELGAVTLIDFGIARTAHTDATSDTTHLGTRAYAPPEQFGFAPTDERSDVYALGLVLWFCLTGAVPDAAARQRGFASPGVSEELRGIIARATAFDPDERYGSVRELKAAFEQVIRGGGSSGEAPAGETPDGAVPTGEAPGGSASPDGEAPHGAAPARSFAFAPHALRDALARVPRGVGVAWNVCVLLALAFFLAASVSLAVHPVREPYGSHPLWARVLEYPIMCGSLFIAVAYALADKRRLRERFPALCRFRWWQQALVIIGALLVIIVVTAALINML